MTGSTSATFGERLAAVTAERGRLCVGIDPHPALLDAWGLADDPDGLKRFVDTVMTVLGDSVAVFKPQSAFFERHGSAGIAVLEQVIARIRAAGALSIVDAKRGDIGSTMAAYADAYAGSGSALAGDAVTVSPYLGFGSLRPLLDVAASTGRGVFVLALTSNPEGAEVQHATGPDDRSVARTVVEAATAENAPGAPGSVGVVVGATVGGAAHGLGLERLNGPILAPGLGAQGGTADDLRAVFGEALPDVLPSMSREVLGAGPDYRPLRAAADRAIAGLAAAVG